MSWIKIADARPRQGQVVDVWHDTLGRVADCIHKELETTYADGQRIVVFRQIHGGYAGGADVTHWMAVPEAPKD